MPSCTEQQTPVRKVSTEGTAELRDSKQHRRGRPCAFMEGKALPWQKSWENPIATWLRFLPDSHLTSVTHQAGLRISGNSPNLHSGYHLVSMETGLHSDHHLF